MIDGETILSNYSLTDPTSTLLLQVSNDYSPGQHVISLVVRDRSGMTTQQDALVNFIDVTAPEISQYEPQIEVNYGVPTILQIFAQDNQSDGLDYTWTIGQGTDNEVQFNGPLVVYEFNSEGPTNVVCRIENDAGLASYADILVLVKESETSSGLGRQVIAVIAVILAIIISVAAFFLYNSAVSRRMSEFSEVEEEDDPPKQNTSPQMQAQMWSRGDTSSSFKPPQEVTRSPLPGDEMFDLLDSPQSAREETRVPMDLEDSLLGLIEVSRADRTFHLRVMGF
jgi:hypothetical protein